MRILASLLLLAGGLSAAEPFAVVELFTSEGCSSCPPAEALLNQIHRRAEKSGQPIYTLAFHVDYWDRLGWKDPFSDAAYSQRQSDYAAGIGENRIYTPQMIVNGQGGFVGSEAGIAMKQIKRALASTPEATVTIKIEPMRDAAGRLVSLQLDAAVEGAKAGALLHLAVVEDGLVTDVLRGENRGRTLRHDGVVRGFSTVPVKRLGEPISIDWPQGVEPSQASVVAYVQAGRSGRIQGATRVAIR